MHHISLIHSFINEHVGCFCLLAIVNYAVMNMGIQITVQVCFSLFGVYPEIELLDYMVILCLII